jgi:hypothetical protein
MPPTPRKTLDQAERCLVCGKPTTSDLKICQRRDQPDCMAAYQQALRDKEKALRDDGAVKRVCIICHITELDTRNKHGICTQFPECRRRQKAAKDARRYENQAEQRAAKHETAKAERHAREQADIAAQLAALPPPKQRTFGP